MVSENRAVDFGGILMLGIHKSNAKPPQYGFFYLGRGFYLTNDPIGDLISFVENIIQFFLRRPGYYHHWWAKWDKWHRVDHK